MNEKFRKLRETATFAEEALVSDIQVCLYNLLEDKGLNRSDLARLMGVSKARVSQIFSDNQNFTVRLLARAFHALGESPHFGLDGHGLEFKGSELDSHGLSKGGALGVPSVKKGDGQWDLVEFGFGPDSTQNCSSIERLTDIAFEAAGRRQSNPQQKADQPSHAVKQWKGSNVIDLQRRRFAA